MGKIVSAVATVHAPQLFTRPPSEIPEQLDADIAAMKVIAQDIADSKPDLAIVIGSDHLETFFLSSVPTFAVVAGETSHAHFANHNWDVPVHLPFADALLDKLMQRGFDMAYSQDAILGHSFAAVYEWVLPDAKIPVVPIFVNTYLPPLPSPQRCMALGKAIAEIIEERPERVAIIASGGMSHYPGTWKYPQPAYDFDYWAIALMERGDLEPLIKLTSEQLDEVGNTEMLPWYFMFGAFAHMGGNISGELLTYQPTWHHGHAVMRFIPNKRVGPPPGEVPAPYVFTQGSFEFYKAPPTSAYKINKILYDLRHHQDLRLDFLKDPVSVAMSKYGMSQETGKLVATITDENIDVLRSLKPHPLVDAGAHPLGMLMSLVVVQAEARRLRAAASKN
jgi:2,3-dihydroxyphenylpropionate 1,2-dioxygenase